jgi:hypothetical protein
MHVSRAQRGTKRSEVVRCRPGTLVRCYVNTGVPHLRCTASRCTASGTQSPTRFEFQGHNSSHVLLGFGRRIATKPMNDVAAKAATTASTAGSEARSATKASTSGAIACITRYGPAIRPMRWP